jgi:hypothetical protein
MKMKIVLAALLIVLLNTGSSCINDGFQVAVNLPISHTWTINKGTNTHFTEAATAIALANQIDASYQNKIKGARYYDIRVSVGGPYTGTVTNGVATINGTKLFDFHGTWDQLKTPQSLLGSSSLITPNTAGVLVLVNALNSFVTNSSTTISLAASGDLSTAPNVDGMTLTVEILAQVDAEVGGSNN